MTTTTTTTRITITRRMTTLGYGWTTRPSGEGSGIQNVTRPSVVGGWRAIEAEHGERIRATSGGVYYREVLFVRGSRVVADSMDVSTILAEIAECGSAIVDVETRPQGRPLTGRERKAAQTAVRLPESLRARLGARATADGVTAGTIICRALEAYLGAQV